MQEFNKFAFCTIRKEEEKETVMALFRDSAVLSVTTTVQYLHQWTY